MRRQIASGAITSLTGDGSAEDERGIIMVRLLSGPTPPMRQPPFFCARPPPLPPPR